MSNFMINWWRSQKLKSALQRGDRENAVQILQKIKKSGARLSWIEKLFRDNLIFSQESQEYQQKIANLSQQIAEVKESNFPLLLKPNTEFIQYIYQAFELVEHDEYKLQATGIDQLIFTDFEAKLVEFLQTEFSKISYEKLEINLADALEDIHSLKIGKDPDYGFSLTPHVYFMKYFLENVYCLYLAWFIIYQSGLLPCKLNILDIAAGPGTSAYGLALFLQSCSRFFDLPQMHISYYSLEKQDAFQYRGLQFWRKYIESRITPINTFFRFVTSDIFTWDDKCSNIPTDFFDFIVISHCFFADKSKRIEANNIYKEIFANSLNDQGYVLLIIQDKRLFKAYDAIQVEDKAKERNVVNQFIDEMGLKLVWYRYLISTASRKTLPVNEFAKFAQERLPKQPQMSLIMKQYFGQKYQNNYTLDDYVILAKKEGKHL